MGSFISLTKYNERVIEINKNKKLKKNNKIKRIYPKPYSPFKKIIIT